MGRPASPGEPADPARVTAEWDRLYSAFARSYDLAVRFLPVWKTWLKRALPHIRGPRVLEISFGTGYLLSRYADRFECHGVDINRKMIETAQRGLDRTAGRADLVRANVERLPYPDGTFDSIVNTMAFSGYPRGLEALTEMKRVLRADGRLILIDFAYPRPAKASV